MPFKSHAQRRRAEEQVKKGEITQETFDKWHKDTPKDIPDRIHPKKEPKK